MAWKLTIATVDVTNQIEASRGATINLGPLNAMGRARFSCRPGLLPDRLAEVVMYAQDGTTPLFGGLIQSRSMAGVIPGVNPAITDVDCADWGIYADWVLTSLSYDADVTLKAVLTDLVDDHLSAYGITLHVGQVDGPTLAAFTWDGVKVSDALRELSTRTGYVFRFYADKSLRMFVPGTDSAPFAITTAAPRCRDLTWRDSTRMPANAVILLCGPSSGAFLYVGQRTKATGETSWTFDVRGSTSPWTILVGASYVDVTPVGGGGRYEWDEATFTLFLGTDPAPADGTVFEVSYWVDYPFEVTDATGATPVIYQRASAPSILSVPPALEAAGGLLAQLDQSPREFEAVSLEHGWEPGQALTIAVAARDLDGSHIIDDVTISLLSDGFWVYRFSGQETTTYQGSYLDAARQLFGGGGSSGLSVSGGGGGGSVTVLGSPAPLGGTDLGSFAAAAYTRVLNASRFVAQGSFTGRVRCELWARNGAGVTARLYDETAAASAGASSEVTSGTRVSTSFVVSITSGHSYILQAMNTSGSGEVYVNGGTLEST
jgi:hypothetical protein